MGDNVFADLQWLDCHVSSMPKPLQGEMQGAITRIRARVAELEEALKKCHPLIQGEILKYDYFPPTGSVEKILLDLLKEADEAARKLLEAE